jgi:outer membrane lipopolysaccharide assembly protein LptE/RlpB
MMTLYKNILCSLGLLLLTAGCGYHVGVRDMMHPQIRSVAVAPVTNNTLEPLAADVLRMQVSAEFQRDGVLKLKQISNADCVLYATITEVKNRSVREDAYDSARTYRPAQFEITVEVEFTVLIPGSGNPLIKKKEVSGSALYEILTDPAVARANALKYACFHAAQRMVQSTTEAW